MADARGYAWADGHCTPGSRRRLAGRLTGAGRAGEVRDVLVCTHCGRGNPEDARFCNACGSPLAALVAERRKLATLVFCDVVGSTAAAERADAEAIRRSMLAYFARTREVLERHGGTVEKFVGDAVLAVFGVPEAHEDDALRACRAALELRAPNLRIGVNTG